MEALIKTDAFGKTHKVYQIGNFKDTCRLFYFSENFRRYVYVDENFEYFVVEKYRTENDKICVYRTNVVDNIIGRVIHGFYRTYHERAHSISSSTILQKLREEYVETRIEFPLRALAPFGLPVDKAWEVVKKYPNASAKELLTVLNQL